MSKPANHITIAQLERFRERILSCATEDVIAFLKRAESAKFASTNVLLGYHDALLLLAAYPSSKELFDEANNRLKNFHTLARKFTRSNKRAGEKLINSGLRGTEIHGAFTYPLLHALRKYYPAYLFLHSLEDEDADVAAVLRHFLPSVEFETLNADYSSFELFEELFGKGDPLVQVIDVMDSQAVNAELRDQLFSNLKIYTGIILDGTMPDRSTARGMVREPFLHEQIQRKADPVEVISRPLPKPEKLTAKQEEEIILNSMCMLATLNRETDPVSSCAKNGVTLFQLERGVSVVLFSMEPGRRMPLESYIGYVLFKNGVPHAYGGSWIFGNRALFGINIFEPFRGGESSLTILQLLRVYHNYFGVSAFSVEPYQFGKDNPEGIDSGAYWFYYKMGFRSDDKQLARLAEKEISRMKTDADYRTPKSTLLRFTESRITWRIKPNVPLSPDPSAISKEITAFVRKYFFGDRKKAVAALRHKIGADADNIPDEYILAFLRYQGNKLMPLLLPEQVSELWLSKQTDERRYNTILASLLVVNQ